MGVRGLLSYITSTEYNFREIKLQTSFIILDGYNFINSLYHDSTLLTQYNGEYLEFDNAIEEFLQNLKKCNLDPIFVFDGVHEVCVPILNHKASLMVFTVIFLSRHSFQSSKLY